MKIKIIAFGKTREEYLKKAISDYLKRVCFYCQVEWIEIVLLTNSKSIRQRINKLKQELQSHFVIAMDEKGSEYTSREFAGFIEKMMVSGKEHIAFLLGGHDGLSLELLKSADMTISLSRLTFTHQMVRLIFIEQLYRAFTIIKGEAYHH
ncbi:MAG: 23S rRNA (pseudouridine(1915)-N(3))-methyltransferase RlmH [bacterium]